MNQRSLPWIIGLLGFAAPLIARGASPDSTRIVGETNSPGLLFQEITTAYGAGVSNVIINPGTYVMTNGRGAAFNLRRLNNFTLSASNALFLVDAGECFHLDHCTNVIIQGAVVRPKVYAFTQGRITHIAAGTNGNAYCDWRIDDGYPTNHLEWWFNAVTADTRTFDRKTGDLYSMTNHEYLGEQTWRIFFGRRPILFHTNDWLVARNGGQGFAFFLQTCSNCTLQNVTSESGGFATYREDRGGGNHMLGCRIQPSPTPPPGGAEIPVVACAADGVHTTGTYPGMDFEDCVFQGMFLDDNIAIHGSFQAVVSCSGNKVVFDGPGAFMVGEPVRISNARGFFAQANCVAIQNLTNKQFAVTLDQTLDVPAGAKASNPKRNGSGYRIIHCQLGNCRSRAIICKSDDGLISGCIIENFASAIQLGPEYSWNESDYVWGVTIINNRILHGGYVGVSLVGDGAIGNRDIAIHDNYFEDILLGNAVDIKWSNGVKISGNNFLNPATGHPLIYLQNSTNIIISGNTVNNAPAGFRFVETGAGVQAVQNMQ